MPRSNANPSRNDTPTVQGIVFYCVTCLFIQKSPATLTLWTAPAISLNQLNLPGSVPIANLSIYSCSLAPSQPINPIPTDFFTLEHDINFLTVIPTLRVLVAISLNPDLLIDDHQLDVTRSLLSLGKNWRRLVGANVEVIMQMLQPLWRERFVQCMRDHLIGAPLHWQNFTLYQSESSRLGFVRFGRSYSIIVTNANEYSERWLLSELGKVESQLAYLIWSENLGVGASGRLLVPYRWSEPHMELNPGPAQRR